MMTAPALFALTFDDDKHLWKDVRHFFFSDRGEPTFSEGLQRQKPKQLISDDHFLHGRQRSRSAARLQFVTVSEILLQTVVQEEHSFCAHLRKILLKDHTLFGSEWGSPAGATKSPAVNVASLSSFLSRNTF
jgi:hypothetical protein